MPLRLPLGLALLLAGCACAAAQSTLPSSSSTAGVSIQSFGRSVSPAELTPTGPNTPPALGRQQSKPPPTLQTFQPARPQKR